MLSGTRFFALLSVLTTLAVCTMTGTPIPPAYGTIGTPQSFIGVGKHTHLITTSSVQAHT